ncbi:MAG: hypothetical protein P9L92_04125 [Candidatus Electryonea clarkiae]|nr:hypothetical protein [Candidatus Electryonea clarkiae]MDP8286048.1 hypothetical protein [Candidatus Electryonea clarkiae]
MAEKTKLKAQLKKYKKLEKNQPFLFARIASIEREMGQFKAAKKRLELGVKKYPDYTTGRILLAETLSAMHMKDDALKAWRKALKKEPLNHRAVAGYISELTLTGDKEALQNEMFHLFRLDPENNENTRKLRYQLLAKLRENHPEIVEWSDDWHVGDFLSNGAFAKKIASELGIAEDRYDIPRDAIPKIDLSSVRQIIENKPFEVDLTYQKTRKKEKPKELPKKLPRELPKELPEELPRDTSSVLTEISETEFNLIESPELKDISETEFDLINAPAEEGESEEILPPIDEELIIIDPEAEVLETKNKDQEVLEPETDSVFDDLIKSESDENEIIFDEVFDNEPLDKIQEESDQPEEPEPVEEVEPEEPEIVEPKEPEKVKYNALAGLRDLLTQMGQDEEASEAPSTQDEPIGVETQVGELLVEQSDVIEQPGDAEEETYEETDTEELASQVDALLSSHPSEETDTILEQPEDAKETKQTSSPALMTQEELNEYLGISDSSALSKSEAEDAPVPERVEDQLPEQHKTQELKTEDVDDNIINEQILDVEVPIIDVEVPIIDVDTDTLIDNEKIMAEESESVDDDSDKIDALFVSESQDSSTEVEEMNTLSEPADPEAEQTLEDEISALFEPVKTDINVELNNLESEQDPDQDDTTPFSQEEIAALLESVTEENPEESAESEPAGVGIEEDLSQISKEEIDILLDSVKAEDVKPIDETGDGKAEVSDETGPISQDEISLLFGDAKKQQVAINEVTESGSAAGQLDSQISELGDQDIAQTETKPEIDVSLSRSIEEINRLLTNEYNAIGADEALEKIINAEEKDKPVENLSNESPLIDNKNDEGKPDGGNGTEESETIGLKQSLISAGVNPSEVAKVIDIWELKKIIENGPPQLVEKPDIEHIQKPVGELKSVEDNNTEPEDSAKITNEAAKVEKVDKIPEKALQKSQPGEDRAKAPDELKDKKGVAVSMERPAPIKKEESKNRMAVGGLSSSSAEIKGQEFNLKKWFDGSPNEETDNIDQKAVTKSRQDVPAKQGDGEASKPVTKTYAQLLLDQGKYELAVNVCKKLNETNPDDLEVNLIMEEAIIKLGRESS